MYASPVYAGISPKNSTHRGATVSVVKNLSWGGGSGSTYSVEYYDGKATIFYDPRANYYSTTVSSTYQLGPLSSNTWSNTLRVSTVGGSYTDTGSVKLQR